MIAQSSDQSNWNASPGKNASGTNTPRPRGLLFPLPGGLPVASEGRHAIVGAVVAEGDQIGVQLLDRPLLLARLPRLLPQHMRQLVGVRVQLARPVRDVELRLDAVRAQVFADRVPRQPRAPRYLPDREMVSIMPASDDAQ